MDERTLTTAVVARSRLAAPGAFVAGLVAQDFVRLGGALAPDAHLRALLPAGLREWTGADVIADRFAGWFGETERFDGLESAVAEVGGRVHLRWRLRLEAERLGPGAYVVEQVGYADVDARGRIAGLDLVCTGFLRERSDA